MGAPGTGGGGCRGLHRTRASPQDVFPQFFILISGPQGGSAPPESSPEDSRGTSSVQISGQAHDAIPPAVCTYGVFSTPPDVAHLLLYDRSAT